MDSRTRPSGYWDLVFIPDTFQAVFVLHMGSWAFSILGVLGAYGTLVVQKGFYYEAILRDLSLDLSGSVGYFDRFSLLFSVHGSQLAVTTIILCVLSTLFLLSLVFFSPTWKRLSGLFFGSMLLCFLVYFFVFTSIFST